MADARLSFRRDPRRQFPHGTTKISMAVASEYSPEISNVSAAGLGFVIGADAALEVGDHLHDVTLTLGACRVRGNLTVRNVSRAEGGRVSCGCLFYPACPAETERWMIVVNTVDAVMGTG